MSPASLGLDIKCQRVKKTFKMAAGEEMETETPEVEIVDVEKEANG